MRALAGLFAEALAILRPPLDGTVSLPGRPTADWLSALERHWSRQPLPAEPTQESSLPVSEPLACDCDCPAPRLEWSDAGVFFGAGLRLWPALDVFWLFRLAWQRRVAALARALQVRPPDRP